MWHGYAVARARGEWHRALWHGAMGLRCRARASRPSALGHPAEQEAEHADVPRASAVKASTRIVRLTTSRVQSRACTARTASGSWPNIRRHLSLLARAARSRPAHPSAPLSLFILFGNHSTGLSSSGRTFEMLPSPQLDDRYFFVCSSVCILGRYHNHSSACAALRTVVPCGGHLSVDVIGSRIVPSLRRGATLFQFFVSRA
jgi:hypothetical protein